MDASRFMDPAYAATHAEADLAHWWFLGRRAIIVSEIARWLPEGPRRIAELGCGSGGLLPSIGRLGEVIGVEADPFLRATARERGLDVVAGALPDAVPLPAGELDAVCLFDVLEHLDDDGRALRAAAALLKPGGLLFVTVPAYGWLWTRHDEVLGHRRRYTARQLRHRLLDAGLAVERLTYFNALLAPPIILARLGGRLVGRRSHDLGRPWAPLNRWLARCFAAERHLLRWSTLPFGISLLAAARRPPTRG